MMSEDSNRCRTADEIAAFVAGHFEGAELMRVQEHFRRCDDCRLVLSEAARADRENQEAERAPAEPMRPTLAIRPWWLAVAAAGLAGLGLWLSSSTRPDSPSLAKILVEAAPHDARYLEPRVSGGFPWAPIIPSWHRETEIFDPRMRKIVGAAREVLANADEDPSIEAQHAAALAYLLTGRPSEATTLLTQLTTSAPSARIWNDLAASQYVQAVKLDRPTQLAHALAAADAALRLDPNYAEALFNRALTIERLGLRNEAGEAWKSYVNVDSSSAWAAEARHHLQENH